MIVRNHHHIVLPSEIASVLVPGAPGSHYKAPTVVVKHDRAPTLIRGGCPYVQYKAIFGRQRFFGSERGSVWLKGWWPRGERFANAGPWFKWRRCLETIRSGHWTGVRNAFEYTEIFLASTTYSSIRSIH